MSYNHPLWAQQDLAAARRGARAARADGGRARREGAGGQGTRSRSKPLEVLFGAGDKLARDIAYAGALEQAPREVSGRRRDRAACTRWRCSAPARPGVSNTRNAMQAAAISQEIFQRNPKHPGAAHYIIHSFDDPDHAILSLTAARAYSKIAPSAAHALHMPSHIFVQLGMWDDVDGVEHRGLQGRGRSRRSRRSLPRGREDFHTLSWLQYAYLQQGKFDEAQKCVDQAKAVADKDTAPNVRDGYASMKARQVVETEQVGEARAADRRRSRTAARPATTAARPTCFAAGVSAANLGDLATAQRRGREAEGDAHAGRVGLERLSRASRSRSWRRKSQRRIAVAQKDTAAAERLIKEATAIELTLDAPSGPAEPIKPSFELYGELLLELERPAEAAAQFQQSLKRMPNRRAALEGLRSARPAQQTTTAARAVARCADSRSGSAG